MFLLKQILGDCEIGQREFALRIGIGVASLNAILNKSVFPKRTEKTVIRNSEKEIEQSEVMMGWLHKRGLAVKDVWRKMKPGEFVNRNLRPKDHSRRVSRGMKDRSPGLKPGNPNEIEQKEVEMITPRALKHFKMFKSPFLNDISDTRDIFFSEDHLFLKEMMLDTARYAGFTAVTGEVGSGKSVMRKAVFQELLAEDVKVVFPVIVDKSRITPASLIDAIIMDISEENPKMRLEAKTRQALRLLRNRATSGLKQVLMIEEAHLLNVAAMKALKQIYELEDGFGRLIGIILIGQPELKFLLDEARHPEMREVTRRVTCAEIAGLNGDLDRYVAYKFGRMKKKVDDVFEKDAFEAMDRRLKDKLGNGRVVSRSYPLTVNNLVSRAMNMAAEMGEAKVSGEVVMAL